MKKYITSLRNLEYRLRAFKEYLPSLLEDVISSKEYVIVSAIANEQLYRRGVTGKDVKIASYAPYAPSTILKKKKKGQPTSRVTLRDTGVFHESMFIVFEQDGFYITSDNYKTPFLVKRYGDEIFRLTDKNLTRILKTHVRKELTKRIKAITKRK